MTERSSSSAALVRQHANTSRLMGVDFVPVYRTAAPQSDAQSPAPPAVQPALAHTPSGRDRAAVRKQLDDIRARYEADAPHTRFQSTHTTIVFDDGDPCARLMFIGEAPGADEDRVGRPFVGRGGQLLDKMIVAMGLRREDIYIANVLKVRPPNNATPTIEEAAASLPYLLDQVSVVRPEVIVTLGLSASRAVLQTESSMGQLRGRWTELRRPASTQYPELVVAVMPTFHPAFLLRQYTAENRAKVWSDLQQVMLKLGMKTRAPA